MLKDIATSPSTPQSPARSSRPWRWLLLLAGLFIVDVILVYSLQTSQRVSAGDFYIRWLCSREMVFFGNDPYSDAVTVKVQITFTGAPFPPEVEDKLSFNYPLYTSLFIMPLLPLPYPLAEAIWNALNHFAMFGIVWAILRLIGWQPRNRSQQLLPYLCAYLFYPFIYNYTFGQFAEVSLLFAMFGALLIQRERYALGGAVLALSVIKPQTGALFVACLLLWCLLNWRQGYRALASAAGVGLVLLVGPMYWFVDWPFRWLNQAAYYRAHYPGYYSYIEETFKIFGLKWSTAITVGSLFAVPVGLAFFWLVVRERHHRAALPYLVAMSGIIGLLILPQLGFCNAITFYPAGYLILQWMSKNLSHRLVIILPLLTGVLLYLPVVFASNLLPIGITAAGIIWLVIAHRRVGPKLQPARELSKTPLKA